MSLPSVVNKEKFRLLDLSTEDDSEDLQLEIIPSRKKKITRRDRNRGTLKVPEPNIGKEVQCALRWAIRGTLVLWLLMLTWICAHLYDQVSTMKLEVTKVSTSSNSVGDALQVCHTAAKELRAQATDLSNRLTTLEQGHLELVQRVQKAVEELAGVSGQLSSAPKLTEIPKRLGDLEKTVGELGSQINGFDGAINSARKLAVTAATGVDDVRNMFHQLEAKTNDTIANVSANGKLEEEIRLQVSAVNSTLAGRVDKLETKLERISRPPTTTVAPTTSTTTTSTTTMPSTTGSTTTYTQTGPPAKPSVTQ